MDRGASYGESDVRPQLSPHRDCDGAPINRGISDHWLARWRRVRRWQGSRRNVLIGRTTPTAVSVPLAVPVTPGLAVGATYVTAAAIDSSRMSRRRRSSPRHENQCGGPYHQTHEQLIQHVDPRTARTVIGTLPSLMSRWLVYPAAADGLAVVINGDSTVHDRRRLPHRQHWVDPACAMRELISTIRIDCFPLPVKRPGDPHDHVPVCVPIRC